MITKNRILFLAILMGLVTLSACSPSPNLAVPSTERDALVAFYNSTNGDNWKNNTGWLADVGTECSWFGIMCINNHVYTITLPINQLKGNIPKELAQLKELFHLQINNNELSGNIPAELGKLTHLNALIISFNKLTGKVPTELGNIKNLTVLNLSNNELTGEIPSELGQLERLTTLALSKNRLTGSIPIELSQLSQLTLLALNQNKLIGEVPSEFVALQKIRQLYLYKNCVKVKIDDQLLQDFLEEKNASVARKRSGCVEIEREAGIR